MSTKDPNMKVIIGADTKDFDKGAKDVKQGLKDLSKTGDQAIGSIGKAFGVNTDKVNQMVSAVRGLGAKMTEASSTGVRAFGQLQLNNSAWCRNRWHWHLCGCRRIPRAEERGGRL